MVDGASYCRGMRGRASLFAPAAELLPDGADVLLSAPKVLKELRAATSFYWNARLEETSLPVHEHAPVTTLSWCMVDCKQCIGFVKSHPLYIV